MTFDEEDRFFERPGISFHGNDMRKLLLACRPHKQSVPASAFLVESSPSLASTDLLPTLIVTMTASRVWRPLGARVVPVLWPADVSKGR